MKRWIVVWSLRRWQRPGYLPWCDQRRGLYAPDLNNLARYLRRQEGQHLGSGSIIGYPHEVFVDENGIVMSGLMGGSSMADVRQWDVLLAGSGETVQGAWDRVGAMWVQGPLVFGHCAFDGDSPVDVTVADVDHLVISKVLATALVGPAIKQFLPCDLVEEFIRVVHHQGNLDVFP